MEFLPKALGTRPRLAVEVRTEGVVAARAEDAAGLLAAVSHSDVAEGWLAPGLKAGNVVERARLASAVRSTLDAVAETGAARTRDVTVIVPDAAVRVLLLDFDALPSKMADALPVVRFRLKKLLPFEVEDAVVTFQVMSSAKDAVTVLAVAIPRDVLAEYEGVLTAAGYVPGAVLPSTLAALAGLANGANGSDGNSEPATLVVNAGAQNVTTAIVRNGILLLHRTLEMNADADGVSPANAEFDRVDAEAMMQAKLVAGELARVEGASAAGGDAAPVAEPGHSSVAWEVAQAVSVAAAYFEDTLGVSPEQMLAAGTTNAESLERMLRSNGLEGLRVRELMAPAMFAAGAATARVPRGWLAGVRGALTN